MALRINKKVVDKVNAKIKEQAKKKKCEFCTNGKINGKTCRACQGHGER